MKQKKFYIAPEMDIENVIVETALLGVSTNPFEGSTQGTEESE